MRAAQSPFNRRKPHTPPRHPRLTGDVKRAPGSEVERTTGDRWQIPGLTFTHGACYKTKHKHQNLMFSPLKKRRLNPISTGLWWEKKTTRCLLNNDLYSGDEPLFDQRGLNIKIKLMFSYGVCQQPICYPRWWQKNMDCREKFIWGVS